MPWAQQLDEAEGLSVVPLIGFIDWWVLADCDWGLWAGPGYSWDGDFSISGFSLGSGGIFPPLLQEIFKHIFPIPPNPAAGWFSAASLLQKGDFSLFAIFWGGSLFFLTAPPFFLCPPQLKAYVALGMDLGNAQQTPPRGVLGEKSVKKGHRPHWFTSNSVPVPHFPLFDCITWTAGESSSSWCHRAWGRPCPQHVPTLGRSQI